MVFPSRCRSDDIPFFRVLLSFHSMLTINRYCHSLKILSLLRSRFDLFKSTLPIILHEVTTNEEITLSNTSIVTTPINSGIYLVLLEYNIGKYQPLFDVKLIPRELFPEKDLLPKSMPFVIDKIESFVKLLSNVIDYMKEYERTKMTCQKDANVPNIHMSRNSYQTSSSIISTDFLSTSSLALSIIPIYVNHKADIRNYTVTDPQRINRTLEDINSLPFTFQTLTPEEQYVINDERTLFSIVDIFENHQYIFDENELVLFKHRLSSLDLDPLLSLDLRNCIHQLAIEKKLDIIEVCNILMKLNFRIIHNELHNKHIPSIIHDLQQAASENTKNTILSNLMKTLLRIDHLEKFNKLTKQTVQLFNERINHLARLGVLNHQSKILTKLFQLDLFESEPNQEIFSHFIHNDLQRMIPKKIPLNTLGINEIIHQLQMNMTRLGIVTTLILIDNFQQFVQTGLLLTLNKTPQFKHYLIQFVNQIQSGRFIGIYLQRLIEQMNHNIRMNSMKNVLLTNQLNSLLQKKISASKLISTLMNSALKGQLNAFVHNIIRDTDMVNPSLNKHLDTYDNNDDLQSLLAFLHEQSSAASPPGPLPYHYVCDFIQYLRHFAQLGILYTPKIAYLLTDLHKAKDHDSITLITFKNKLEQMKTINYVYVYDHLNLVELYDFLNKMILDDNLTRGQSWYILDRLINLCQIEPITNYDIQTFLTNLQLECNRQRPIYPKLIDSFQSLAASYSKSLAELQSLERDLRNILLPSNNNIKRIPDEVRRRLNEMILLCKQFSIDRTLLEQLFGPTMNYKLYNKMKEILKTKNLISRKQSVTAIVQMHKHFLQISSLQTQHCLTEQQLDLILQNIHDHYSEKQTYFEDIIKHMTELGYLQDKLFVDYCTQHFLSDEFFSSMVEVQNQFQTWPFILELNHSHVREVVKHLTQLELDGKLDYGTSIEIQNRLNQIARFGRWFSPRIKSITEEILKSQGKRFLSDRNGYQSIQLYRLLLNDITHAIEFELYLQELLFEHQISDRSYSYYRHFLHRILQNELNIDELTRYRTQLNAFHHVKRMDIGQTNGLS